MRFNLLFLLLCNVLLSASAQKVGINTETPVTEIDVRTTDVNDGAELNVGNQDNSHFLRLFSGRPAFAKSVMYWKEGYPLLFGTDQNSFTELMQVTSGGFLGIGVQDPQSRLDVLGGQWNVSATEGDIRLGNNIYRLVSGVAVDGGGAGISRIYAKGGQAKLIFGSDNTDVMAIDSANRVGIGTMTPLNRLDIRNDGAFNTPTIVLGLISDISNRPVLQFSEWDAAVPNSGMAIEYNGESGVDNKINILGTDAQPKFTFTTQGFLGIATQSPNEYLEIGGSGRMFIGDGGGSNRKGLLIDAVEPGNYVRLHPFDYSTGTSMDLFLPGNVNIGQATGANGYRLSVDGKIIAEELRIQLSGVWPDYVFSENYVLPDLGDLERSIQLNKHLPGIPSAQEIHSNGLLVGDMQTRIVKKIEELTLYIIRQDKDISQLKQELEDLKNKQ